MTRRAAVAVTLVPSICTIDAASTAPSAVRRAAPATSDGDGRGVRTARARRVAGEERPSAPSPTQSRGPTARPAQQPAPPPAPRRVPPALFACSCASALLREGCSRCPRGQPGRGDRRRTAPAGEGLAGSGSHRGWVRARWCSRPRGENATRAIRVTGRQGPTAALRLGQRAGDDGPGDDTVRSLPPPVLDGGPPCPCPCSCPWSSLGGFFLGFAAPGSRSWQ